MIAYTYINISNPLLSLTVILWGVYVGIVLACIISVVERNTSNALVKSLLMKGADSPENALTIGELGLKDTGKYLSRLKKYSRLRRTVLLADEEKFTPKKDATKFSYKLAKFFSYDSGDKEKLTPEARFYIPEENRITAEVRYAEKRSGAMTVIVCAVLMAAAMVFMTYALPKLLEMLDTLIGAIA